MPAGWGTPAAISPTIGELPSAGGQLSNEGGKAHGSLLIRIVSGNSGPAQGELLFEFWRPLLLLTTLPPRGW